jgi:hypothetical protein
LSAAAAAVAAVAAVALGDAENLTMQQNCCFIFQRMELLQKHTLIPTCTATTTLATMRLSQVRYVPLVAATWHTQATIAV